MASSTIYQSPYEWRLNMSEFNREILLRSGKYLSYTPFEFTPEFCHEIRMEYGNDFLSEDDKNHEHLRGCKEIVDLAFARDLKEVVMYPVDGDVTVGVIRPWMEYRVCESKEGKESVEMRIPWEMAFRMVMRGDTEHPLVINARKLIKTGM